MKKCFCSFLLVFFLFLLLSSSTLSTARNIADKKELVEISNSDSEMAATQELASLLGEKTCNGGGGGEEECLRRRIISEAHLDYIYAQLHKP